MHNRIYETFSPENPVEFKWQMLNWASRFNICAFLDNHSYSSPYQKTECLLGAGCIASFSSSGTNTLQQLREWKQHQQDWIFGHLGFELSAETEGVPPLPQSHTSFAPAFFFVPEAILEIQHENRVRIGVKQGKPETIFNAILQTTPDPVLKPDMPAFTASLTRAEYISRIEDLQRHIHRGDCYEINFCQEFFTRPSAFEPASAYRSLSSRSPAPFSCFYKIKDQYVMGASPERYLQKTGTHLISQPIKGTAPRHADPEKDRELAAQLLKNAKEKAENIMIVDLVRNDLSRVCTEASVSATEICGLYHFPQVHQLISTIEGNLAPETPWTDAIAKTFPMGSMTGAPKKRVLELTRRYETTGRGIYSGAIGYVNTEDDFDFNVVIRSLVYNEQQKYLSYHVGSGITGYSNAESEYEECLLKARGILSALIP